jgi:hypothetical protein
MGWADLVRAAMLGFSDIGQFGAWLGIHPSTQDFAKAIILVIFVLIILMIVGDVYRGEIQNRFFQIRLIPTPKRDGPRLRQDANPKDVKRLVRRERDEALHVPNRMLPITLDKIFSNSTIFLRYRDLNGNLRTKKLYSCRVKFKVKVAAFPYTMAGARAADHQYTEDERDFFTSEDEPTIVSMAKSRVDYLYEEEEGLIDKHVARLRRRYKSVQGSKFHRALGEAHLGQFREPEVVGLVMRFNFPIDPYFLLYKHPDTNVKTTAWLTVLTSVFALFMQLMFTQPGDEEAIRARAPRAQQQAAIENTADLTSKQADR